MALLWLHSPLQEFPLLHGMVFIFILLILLDDLTVLQSLVTSNAHCKMQVANTTDFPPVFKEDLLKVISLFIFNGS